MIDENKIKKIIDGLDFGDWRILGIGALLLFVPIFIISLISSNKGSKIETNIDAAKLGQMVNRKNVFNFGKNQTVKATQKNKESARDGWLTKKTPEQQIADELRSAMQIIERSKPDYIFPRDFTENQKQAYMAEHSPELTRGRAAMERGDYKEAERLLKAVYEEGAYNPFLQAYAMGELCALYEKMRDLKALEAAFKLYMEAVGRMPAGFGGGNLTGAVRDAYMSLKHLKESLDTGRGNVLVSGDAVVQALDITTPDVSNGLARTLEMFPAKFK